MSCATLHEELEISKGSTTLLIDPINSGTLLEDHLSHRTSGSDQPERLWRIKFIKQKMLMESELGALPVVLSWNITSSSLCSWGTMEECPQHVYVLPGFLSLYMHSTTWFLSSNQAVWPFFSTGCLLQENCSSPKTI